LKLVENISATFINVFQVSLLVVVKLLFWKGNIGILKDDRETSNPILNVIVSRDQILIQAAYSSETALNWPGASTNSFRILFASSIAAIKSPTLKPKLIVMSRTALLLAHEKVG
jgi:hypothetical protein